MPCRSLSLVWSHAHWVVVLWVIFIPVIVCSTPENRQPSQPNIVFIMADDLGYGEVGYHNTPGSRRRVLTPNIDKLATRGVRLENYYVEPICTPTRSQFMSGRSQIHTGLQHKNIQPKQPNALPLDSPTLADKLKESGYSTHMIGKWHLGFYKKEYLPTSRGFDSFYGKYLGSGDHYTHRPRPLSCKHLASFDSQCRVCAIDLHDDTPTKQQGVSDKHGVYSTHLFTQKAVETIHEHNPERPMFLFLSYQAVHGPLQVPKKYIRLMRRRFRRISRNSQSLYKSAMTLAMDIGIGKVYNALKRKGLWNNTVLIFSSDNGAPRRLGGTNLPLRGYKGTFNEGGIRVAGFVNSPLLQRQAYTNWELMHVTDWFPTLVRLANGTLEGTRDVNGFDQWDVISKQTPTERQEILHNIDPWQRTRRPLVYNETFDTRWRAALRQGDFKLITGLGESPGFQLYNIRKDPLEEHNLVPTHQAKVKDMLDRLQEHQRTAVPVRFPRRQKARMGKFWRPWRDEL